MLRPEAGFQQRYGRTRCTVVETLLVQGLGLHDFVRCLFILAAFDKLHDETFARILECERFASPKR